MGFSTERETKKMQANFNYRWPHTIRPLIKQFESDLEESLPVDMTSLKGPLAVARRGCGTALPVVGALWPYGPLTQLSFLRGTMYTRTALPEMLQCFTDNQLCSNANPLLCTSAEHIRSKKLGESRAGGGQRRESCNFLEKNMLFCTPMNWK